MCPLSSRSTPVGFTWRRNWGEGIYVGVFKFFFRSVELQVESQACLFSLLFQREEHRCGQGRPDPGEGGLQVDHAGPGRQGAGGRRRGYQGRRPQRRREENIQVNLRNSQLQRWCYSLEFNLSSFRAGRSFSALLKLSHNRSWWWNFNFPFLSLTSLMLQLELNDFVVVFSEFVRGQRGVHSPRDRRRLPLPVSPKRWKTRETEVNMIKPATVRLPTRI